MSIWKAKSCTPLIARSVNFSWRSNQFVSRFTSVKSALSDGSDFLSDCCDTPYIEASSLLSSVLNRLQPASKPISSSTLINYSSQQLLPESNTLYKQWLHERKSGKPLAYIVGEKEFWSLSFRVNNATLIPRPETELIIETSLELFPKQSKISILDIGTGSGCILITLLKEFPNANGIAVDMSEAALSVAQTNANIHHVASRSEFRKSNWFSNVSETFDLIVSNPPYIGNYDPAVDSSVKDFEPHTALFAGDDGLNAYREIASNISKSLRPNGYLVLEIGFGQGDQIREIFKNELKFVKGVKDYQQIERTLVFINKQ